MRIHDPRPQLNDLLKETRGNLVRYSQMADVKASILLSISSVLMTLSLNKVANPKFTASIIVLVSFLLVTIFFTLIAVVPKFSVIKRKRSTSDPDYSPLFFGDYVDIPYADYLSHLEEVMNSSDRTYETKIKEIYYAGVYLQKTKYRILKYGYVFFFVGLVSSTTIYFSKFFL